MALRVQQARRQCGHDPGRLTSRHWRSGVGRIQCVALQVPNAVRTTSCDTTVKETPSSALDVWTIHPVSPSTPCKVRLSPALDSVSMVEMWGSPSALVLAITRLV